MQNKLSAAEHLKALEPRLGSLERHAKTASEDALHGTLPVPLARHALHDFYAHTPADTVTLNAFGLGLAVAAAAGKPIVWALHDLMGHEAGRPYAPGLIEMGVDPDNLLLVRARNIQSLLSCAEEALRSPAVGAVLISAWGESRALTLTATKRLAMAARRGGGTAFLARAGAEVMTTAAESRWSIRAHASVALEADAPGHPCFSATLLRYRGGGAPRHWIMEWDRERRVFVEPSSLSGDLVSVASGRTAETDNVLPLRRSA